MSGTSLDGIDAVLVDLGQTTPVQLGKHYLPYDDVLKNDLLALHLPERNELHHALLIGNQLARLYATAVAPLLIQVAASDNKIKAIGCHGQTIRHCPEQGYSLQIGNAALLAELTGVTVVSNFRSRDIAAGGQGAPLVPAFHDRVLRHPDLHRVIINIGGISNLTNLSPSAPTTGFDCGPGNLLLDAWCAKHLGMAFDDGGAWAASGKVRPALLKRMLDEPYFALHPPKSTGRDLFRMEWLAERLTGEERAEDVQATLLELTCLSISQAVQRHCTYTKEIYLCGGGARNLRMIARLAALLPGIQVQTTNALGIDSDYLEAIAFAWLAQQALQNRPVNLTQSTGAKHPCILGAIYSNP